MAWLFGKLPAHGDFVGRGIAGADRDALDTWLSKELAEARERMGEAFEDNYAAMPVWRFVEPIGESEWHGGAMCASVDKVGRRFPIIAALRTADAPSARPAAALCEDCLYDGFDQQWNADQLFGALESQQPEPEEADDMIEPCWWTEGGENFPPFRIPGVRPSGLIARMLVGESV